MTAVKHVMKNAQGSGGPDGRRRGSVARNGDDSGGGVGARTVAAQFGQRQPRCIYATIAQHASSPCGMPFPFGLFMAFAHTYHFASSGVIRQWMNTPRIR